jgi:DDE superfamily endonuclease
MKYETVPKLNAEGFKRATGVQRSTFPKMVEVVEQGLRKFGRSPKLSRAAQSWLTLLYWREDRTEFQIGLADGVSESAVCRPIRKIEDVLIKAKQFHVPGKKKLQSDETTRELVLLDATEQPIERPKKNNASIIVAKNGDTPQKRHYLST